MNRSFCIAPMMRRTDRHFRYMCSLLTKETILFTEMVHANAINRNEPTKFLENSKISNSTVLQLGGSDPLELGKAVLAANEHNFSEINLNLGCPSSKVQSGNFGAVLMKDVNLVKECLSEMISNSKKEISVKIRLGVDNFDVENDLTCFIKELINVGIKTFYVHARIAILQGLDPKENRTIPPLNYQRVLRLKKEFHDSNIIINGGIHNFEKAREEFKSLDGIMIGRAAYDSPYKLINIDQMYFKSNKHAVSLVKVIEKMFSYISDLNVNEQSKAKFHMLNLFKGLIDAKKSRILLLNGSNNEEIKNELLSIIRFNENQVA